ncbi:MULTISPECIES: SRPBCC family protein [Saccharopolyspora]|uniref:SRPBCC family protein n=1 Tax=Saccharopolyspora gregorii TaxID=33914 RepID=A0ABP6RL48_9PSEU|nr:MULTISPECIES: SRPBCC family protein [Saccharopolyspora]MCA1187267.1 SRPBCC family protein [Saccharopolyspora sp. 6T]MCA1193652.1 SRPBCC family protein [Saccharopolyspora sp. 6V]MCA1228167.1 SRPBCC family protein [Saccharopolyspora sp. 6M]MCA1282128.1 SRPBCC family protein [Saccharopolyspora sp. 7B]
MARSYASRVVPAAADEVWALVRDFGGLPRWHPGIGSSEVESGASPAELGAVRRLVVGDGGVVRERLVGLDDAARSCTYEITEGPFPVRSYRSTIRVLPITATGESFVEWYADYDAEAAHEAQLDEIFGGGVFGAGLKALADHYAG